MRAPESASAAVAGGQLRHQLAGAKPVVAAKGGLRGQIDRTGLAPHSTRAQSVQHSANLNCRPKTSHRHCLRPLNNRVHHEASAPNVWPGHPGRALNTRASITHLHPETNNRANHAIHKAIPGPTSQSPSAAAVNMESLQVRKRRSLNSRNRLRSRREIASDLPTVCQPSCANHHGR